MRLASGGWWVSLLEHTIILVEQEANSERDQEVDFQAATIGLY